jgi:hypothetical protein
VLVFSLGCYFCRWTPLCIYCESKRLFMESHPVQVSDLGPTWDVAPLTFYQDEIYISGEL